MRIHTAALCSPTRAAGPGDHGGHTGSRRQESGHRQTGNGCGKGSRRARRDATAGLYDDSGKWLYATGLPAKSDVGGGIIAVSPGRFGIAVISPPLDDAGNSVRAQRAITGISNALGGNPYTPAAK
jgi:hypothetical protein